MIENESCSLVYRFGVSLDYVEDIERCTQMLFLGAFKTALFYVLVC